MMELKSILLSISLLTSTAQPIDDQQQQQPLQQDGPTFDLIHELKKAEIIPTVLDPFKPFLKLNITWSKEATAEVGNTLKPKKLQSAPRIDFLDYLPDLISSSSAWFKNANEDEDNEVPQLTLALTDPDARSRDNPDWSEMCHWIVTGVPLTHTGKNKNINTTPSSTTTTSPKLQTILPYKPPAPPPKTGKHRYIFAALAPRNGTTEKLHLSTPKERQHWGYGEMRRGLRDWAEDNGLEVVGANFVYAEDKKQ